MPLAFTEWTVNKEEKKMTDERELELVEALRQANLECDDLRVYKELFRDLDRRFGCAHTEHGPDDCQNLIRHVDEVLAKLNAPELHDFAKGVVIEAAHQRHRWGSEQDAGKDPQDWFWLIGYLAGKALRAHVDGDTTKALHHTISTAAALNNWHAAILGASNKMRPGIETPKT